MKAPPKVKESYYTVEEYLDIERSTDERYEYVDGQVHLMAGESGPHGDISTNLIREISLDLKGTSCRVRSKDTKVRSGSVTRNSQILKGMFSYPDIVVICGEPEYHDKVKDIILNPKVIFEILSDSTDSTESYDRIDKFTRCRMFNPTLTDYILVFQNDPIVEHYVRQEENNWKLYTYVGLDKTFSISSIGCTLELTEIYDRIEFSDEVLDSLTENIYF